MKTRLLTLALLALIGTSVHAQKGKQIYIPEELRQNDFNNPESKWSYARMAETPNVVCFWEKGFGPDLSKAPDLDGHPMTVDLQNLLSRVEHFYQVYRDMMRFTLPGSKADRYKMMVMLNYSLEGTAYGGCYDDSIGALWIAPNRVQDNRLNCIAHELGHSFQIQISCDGQGHGPGGGFFEMTSQWMLWNVNPEWPTDENYHWRAFIQDANLPFLAMQNIYRSPYMLEYWSMKHGLTVIADLFRQCRRHEDAAQTYMRMFGLSNEQFALEALDCYSRLLSFDFPGKHEVNKRYAGEFLNSKPLGTFGANSIEIKNETIKNGKAKVSFVGDKDKGYAYRLVALNDKAEATYGEICTKQKGTATLLVPADTRKVYLVVTAYPLSQYKPQDDTLYPYTVK
ncbi:MAG: hypothetical protein ILA39_05220 [Bacteroidaceae bacterium]|nr:hypothetical protein [Bacteroidaceae bacterium]